MGFVIRGPYELCGGIEVHYKSFMPEDRRKIAVDRVNQALYLIFKLDSRRYYRLFNDGTTIAIVHGAGGHSYCVPNNTIILDLRRIEGETVSAAALSIVHEATHARIALAGVEYRGDRRARIEWRCVEEEIVFSRHFPWPSEENRVAWEAQQREQFNRPWWGDKNGFRRLAEGLEEAGAPASMVKLLRLKARFARPIEPQTTPQRMVAEREAEVFDRQTTLTRELWAQMQSHDIGATPVLAIDYFFDAPTEAAAIGLRDHLAISDYAARVADHDGRWVVQGTRVAREVTLPIVERWVGWMVAVGARYGCAFDGWGAELPRSQ
jgi:hypothetical protein